MWHNHNHKHAPNYSMPSYLSRADHFPDDTHNLGFHWGAAEHGHILPTCRASPQLPQPTLPAQHCSNPRWPGISRHVTRHSFFCSVGKVVCLVTLRTTGCPQICHCPTAMEQKFSLQKTICLGVPPPASQDTQNQGTWDCFFSKLGEFLDEMLKSTFWFWAILK